MKLHIKNISLLLILAVMLGCDDKLNLSSLGELNSNTFYKSADDFEAASLAPYSSMLNFYYDQGGLGYFNGIVRPSDDARHSGEGADSDNDFIWLPGNGDFSFMYNEAYKGIMRANVIIEKLPQAEFPDEQKIKFEAEARFLRAYFYFFLANNWGTPPLVRETITTLDGTKIGNSKPGEIYDFVELDLIFAKQNLQDSWDEGNLGRVTSGAAQALLGKVYLYRGKYSEAATEFNGVVSSGRYSLMTDFNANFDEFQENNAESLFEVQQTRGDFNPWLPVDFGLNENQDVGHAGTSRTVYFKAGCYLGVCAPGANQTGYGNIHASKDLQDEFEDNDPRRVGTIFEEGDLYFGEPYQAAWSITGSTPSKYVMSFVAYGEPNAGSNNERLIRYSDVLLMLAEAELLGNSSVAKAAEYVNLVRRRADPSGAILPDRPSSASSDEMMDFIMHERRVELAFEGHRYYDITRWHKAGIINIPTDITFDTDLANSNWKEMHLVKPYAQSELDLNPLLVQNPGY